MPPISKSPKSKSTASASTPSPGDLSLEEKVNHIFNMVNKIDVSLGEQQERLTKVETDVNLLSKEVYSLKNIVNSHEQERRSSTIRITGLPLTAEEKKSRNTADLKQRVFEFWARFFLSPTATTSWMPSLLWRTPLSPATELELQWQKPTRIRHRPSLLSCGAQRPGSAS